MPDEDSNFPIVSKGSIGGEMIQTVNARDLHAFLKVGKDFSTWIKDRIEQYGFEENRDFAVFTEIGGNPNGGRPAKEYALSIDTAKEVAMVERNDQGKRARLYFIECERRAKDPLAALNDPAAMRGLLLSYSEKVLNLETQIEASRPKTVFYDAFVNADGLYGLQNAGRALHCSPNLFVRWLKEKFMFYQGNALVPRVQFIQMGIFEVKSEIVDDKARPRSYVTPKGLEYFSSRVPPHIKTGKAA